ncbi:MAG: phage holin family protein [Ilumatobacteraceae bacterium]
MSGGTELARPAFVRPEAERPRWTQVVLRGLVVTIAASVSLWVLAWLLSGFTIERPRDALFAGIAVGILNAVVWPALAFVLVPLSVLTLGIGAIVLDAMFVFIVLDWMPGIEVDDFWTALVIVLGLAFITTILSSVLALDDDAWFDQHMARRAKRRVKGATTTTVPGFVFVQLDGVAKVVFDRARRSGDIPTLDRWVRDGSHRVVGWETGWSSQTGVSQCGILHGSVVDMPAFRWVDKADGTVVVSNRPKSAAAIERFHSDGQGLLAHHGSSYGNLFSGDAERAALTMSNAGKRKEGRVGAGYVGYFSRPQQATRTFIALVVEVARERNAAFKQRRRDVHPRVDRNWTYAFLRAFTTIVSRDVCVQGVLTDIAEGRAAIYVDLLGYDEVSHHSGPDRADTLAVLRDLDHQIARIDRSLKFAPRPYHLVVLSDHGQTQGPTFRQNNGETLAALVGRLCGGATSGDSDAEQGRTESSAWLRQARDSDGGEQATAPPQPTVLGSGSLGLVTLPGEPRRLLREEIDAAYPALIPGLAGHPDIGFVLVGSAEGSLVLGPAGQRNLATGVVTGEDPLAPYGPRTVEQVAQVDAYRTVADLMITSRFDPELDEVLAFEEQVGSHGGLGGPQTHPFLLYPAELSDPVEPIFTSVGMYRVLKTWMVEAGQPVTRPWLDAAPAPAPAAAGAVDASLDPAPG